MGAKGWAGYALTTLLEFTAIALVVLLSRIKRVGVSALVANATRSAIQLGLPLA